MWTQSAEAPQGYEGERGGEIFSVHSPSLKLIFWTKYKKSTVIKLQTRLLSQGTGGQLPMEPGRGASGLGAINTHKNNWKLNALLWPALMIPAGFAQKIMLPFHLPYLLIFLKSVSDISFLGRSHKRVFGCWHRVRGIIGIPGTLCVYPQEQVGAGKSHYMIQGWLSLRAWRATNMCAELYSNYYISESSKHILWSPL